MALKASVPFPRQKANLTGFVLTQDSVFNDTNPGAGGLGYALQGDVLVGQAQLTLGEFYQKDSAPKTGRHCQHGPGLSQPPPSTETSTSSPRPF